VKRPSGEKVNKSKSGRKKESPGDFSKAVSTPWYSEDSGIPGGKTRCREALRHAWAKS